MKREDQDFLKTLKNLFLFHRFNARNRLNRAEPSPLILMCNQPEKHILYFYF